MPAPYTKEDVAAGKAKGPGGRPRKFQTPEEMQAAVDAYFEDNKNYPVKSVYQLAYFLGFTQRASMWDYTERKDEFSSVIAGAKIRIMAYYDVAGQNAKGGHYFDRMLSRLGDVVIEGVQQGGPAVQTLVVLIDDSRRPLAVESREVPSLPGPEETPADVVEPADDPPA